MVKLSWMILASGARQLVVQEALLTTCMSGWYLSVFTPITNMGASADGAEIMTFLAPTATRNKEEIRGWVLGNSPTA